MEVKIERFLLLLHFLPRTSYLRVKRHKKKTYQNTVGTFQPIAILFVGRTKSGRLGKIDTGGKLELWLMFVGYDLFEDIFGDA